MFCRSGDTVSDKVLEKQYVKSSFFCWKRIVLRRDCRRNRDVADVLSAGFSWPAMLDSVADTYLGVSNTSTWKARLVR